VVELSRGRAGDGDVVGHPHGANFCAGLDFHPVV